MEVNRFNKSETEDISRYLQNGNTIKCSVCDNKTHWYYFIDDDVYEVKCKCGNDLKRSVLIVIPMTSHEPPIDTLTESYYIEDGVLDGFGPTIAEIAKIDPENDMPHDVTIFLNALALIHYRLHKEGVL